VLVLAATAIVAAMGVSLYRTQQVRAQIEASIVELEPAQDLVAYQNTQDRAKKANSSKPGRYYRGVWISV
jgi:hypothetical protein